MNEVPTPKIGDNSKHMIDDKSVILSMFNDMASDVDGLIAYLQHVGFDFEAIAEDASQLQDAILGHYRVRQGEYDINRASHDLLTFPPIASRVFQLMEKQRQSNKTGV